MMDLKGTQEDWVGDSEMECGTKNFEKQYRIFEFFLPIVLVKLIFWALSYFGGLKDNVKQTPQVNNNNNDNNNNDNGNNNDSDRS